MRLKQFKVCLLTEEVMVEEKMENVTEDQGGFGTKIVKSLKQREKVRETYRKCQVRYRFWRGGGKIDKIKDR